jgi:uncharacterized protein
MESMSKNKILRFYTSSTDKIKNTPVYEAIANAAKENGLSGATVFKGIMGYGTSSELYSERFWEMVDKVPVVVEIVEKEEQIKMFLDSILPWLNDMPKGCLVTCQDTEILLLHKGMPNHEGEKK